MQQNVFIGVVSAHIFLFFLVMNSQKAIPYTTTTRVLVRTVNLAKEHVREAQEPQQPIQQRAKPSKSMKKQVTEPQRTAKKAIAKTKKQKKQKPTVQKAPKEVHDEIFTQIASSLQKSESLRATKKAVQDATTPLPKELGALQTESSVTIDPQNSLTSQEERYIDELILILKRSLVLPEHGEVRLILHLSRNGKVRNVEILGAKSTKNSTYVEKMLPTLHFAAFGNRFTGEEEHAFLLNLSFW